MLKLVGLVLSWVGARLPLTFNAVYIQTTVVSFHEIIQLNALVP